MAKAHTLVDNFSDNSVDTTKWNPSVGTTRETNGRIEIPLLSGSTGNGSLHAQAPYDLTNSEVRVELVRAPLRHASVEAYLIVLNTAGTYYLKFIVLNGTLIASQWLNGTLDDRTLGTYDPAVHRWLRLRETNGVVHYETSPDGVTWTTLFSNADPFSLSSVYIRFGAAAYQAVPSPGMAIFDNFNVQNTLLARRVEERRRSARDVRVEAAEVAAARRHDEHANNNDEVNYAGRPFIGSYSKSLKHDSLGDPEPISYGTLLRALQSGDPADFEEIQLASSTAVKLTNPQSGLAFDIDLRARAATLLTASSRTARDELGRCNGTGATVILPKVRDPRFITIRRGGTLTDADHRLLALWAAACAEHVLHLFESVQPSDPRPRRAIEQIRAWTRGEIRMMEARAAGGSAMAAARVLSGAARHAAFAAGQAGVVAHVAAHELGAAAYAIKAARAAAPAGEGERAARLECRWQREQLPDAIRELVLDDQRLRNGICWNVFDC
jgi:hypothetical protein